MSVREALLKVDDLAVQFSSRGGIVRAVDGVSFELREGETLGLVGESGCGKSTTGRAVLRLVPTAGGRVTFQQADVLGLKGRALQAFRQSAQMVFQDPFGSLNPRLTVGQIVGEPLWIHHLAPRREIPRQVGRLLDQVGLDAAFAGRYPHEFSGGQRQRIGIARALAGSPQLIVCDEPVSALDVPVQAQIVNLLQDLQEQLGVAYLFIAHNLAVVRHIARRVAVMYLGRIVETGPRESLYSEPRHPYTRALLSAVPVPDPTAKRQRILLSGDVPSAAEIPAGCRFHPRCPMAQERCQVEDPPPLEVAPGHTSACWFAGEVAERMG